MALCRYKTGLGEARVEEGHRERERERDGNEADEEGDEKEGEGKRERREKVRLGTNERLFQAVDVRTYVCMCIRYRRLSRVGPSFRLCIFTVKLAVRS